MNQVHVNGRGFAEDVMTADIAQAVIDLRKVLRDLADAREREESLAKQLAEGAPRTVRDALRHAGLRKIEALSRVQKARKVLDDVLLAEVA